jgi:hypothetical protein
MKMNYGIKSNYYQNNRNYLHIKIKYYCYKINYILLINKQKIKYIIIKIY